MLPNTDNSIDAAIAEYIAKGGKIHTTTEKTITADDDFILALDDCQLELETDFAIAA